MEFTNEDQDTSEDQSKMMNETNEKKKSMKKKSLFVIRNIHTV